MSNGAPSPLWSLAERIDALLPQTQCGRCGYPACRPYAEAIASGEADIDQCPPGGDSGVRALAELLGRTPKPLDPKHGPVKDEETVAWIDETECIGCTRCIQACPVDAILGAAKQMHTVIRAECTGCELCLEPCPVDCIHMLALRQHTPNRSPQEPQPVPEELTREYRQRKADRARKRYENRQARLGRERDERRHRQQRKKVMLRDELDTAAKRAVIQKAVARARQRQAAMKTTGWTTPGAPTKNDGQP